MTRDARALRVCYAGTYERAYPRNRLVIEALRTAGARVEEAHAPVFERRRDKSGLGAVALAGLGLRLVMAYLRLVPEVALRLLRCDALVVGYIGQLDMLVLGPVARAMGKPVLFNPLVTLTDTLVEDRQQLRAGSLPARLIATLDRVALRLADVVLVDTRENGDWIRERLGISDKRIVVVPVGADERVFFPAARANTSQADEALDVLFYGKFIPLHGIDTILRAVALLEKRGAPARVEVVGTGQTYREMRELATALRLTSVIWTDWIPFEHLGERLRRADVALGVFDTGAKAGRVIPNKVYQSLACGVATITRDSPAIRRLLHDGGSALLVPPDDPAALANAIERLRDRDLRERIATGGQTMYQTHASSPAMAAALSPVLTTLRHAR